MLLRRISKHVKEQNWLAVCIDFCIVVLGILLALQVTNWSESRQAIHAENRLQDRLESEFTTLEDELSERLFRAEGLIDSTSTLITYIRLDEEPADAALTKRMLLNASRFSAPVAPPTAFSDGLNSGQISTLSNPELRRALNGYVISTDWWTTVEGAAKAQTDPNSNLNRAIVWAAPSTLKDSLAREVLAYNWSKVEEAELELIAIHRLQTLQAEAYRLELVEVRRVLEVLQAS